MLQSNQEGGAGPFSGDTGYKNSSRVSIRTLTTLTGLAEGVDALQNCQEKQLRLAAANLANVFAHAGYTYEQAKQAALESMFYRIARNTLNNYIYLNMHLHHVGHAQGIDTAKVEILFHSQKLLQIRSMYQTRLQVLCQFYIYLRDNAVKNWRSLVLYEKQLENYPAISWS